jgi:hypothetical protein
MSPVRRVAPASRRRASLREEEQRLRQEEQRRREEAEQQLRLLTQDTTLTEFLDACHIHLFLSMIIQDDPDSSTKGQPENADNKLRPDKIREWKNFPQQQSAIWEDLMDTDFMTERLFTPLVTLKEWGKQVRERRLGSELDLGYFDPQTVESRLASVIKQLYANPNLRQTFCLNGDITFENHANTLTDESKMVDSGSNQGVAQPRIARPRADQFCVYNRGPNEKVPAFIIEYKAPYKLSLAHIKVGLQDMELDQVVRYQKNETPEDICRRVLAAVITQLYSYMIKTGVEYAYICTGEAFIFLRVLRDDPSTVYYYLSVPKEDVGETTGWAGDLNVDNRLHLTALGQILAFTLRALRVPPRDASWRSWAANRLMLWEMVCDNLLNEISEKDIPSSAFKPSTQSRNEYCRASPVKTRSKSTLAGVASCDPSQDPLLPDRDDNSEDEFDPNTPSRRPQEPHLPGPTAPPSAVTATSQGSRSHKSWQYCTQLCLRGLIIGGRLDRECPNVLNHGVDRHQINLETLIHRLDLQISNVHLGPNPPEPEFGLGCESLHIHGTRGALFKVRLWSHGYTFVGKGTPVEFVTCLKHEESVYSHLIQIQGINVPVLLGSLSIRRPFSYDGIVDIVHMMFLSYAGRTLTKRHQVDQNQLVLQAENSLQKIHRLGVLHSDPIPGNMIWCEENDQVMFIDFERAKVQNGRTPLEPISHNQKRNQEICVWDKNPNKHSNCFEREKRCMRHKLQS